MKKLTYLLVALALLTSCSRMVAVQTTSSIDYSKFQKAGFFVTESNSVSFAYEPLSSVSALHLEGIKKNQTPVRNKSFNDYDNYDTRKNWFVPNREEVLADLCKKAKELGANGIINLKIEFKALPLAKGTMQTGYEATAMAIKR